MIKLVFGRGHVVADKLLGLNCPNREGGIGQVVVRCAKKTIWTGDTHLSAETADFHFGSVTEIQYHNDFEENSDVPPMVLWKSIEPFSYEQYREAAETLKTTKEWF